MPVPVMAAIIRDQDRVLLCQRKEGALAGKWEFPGGKIENGESPEECLVREIKEELDIVIEVDQIYKAVNMHYDHGDFLIISYLAQYVTGRINLAVHSNYAWVHQTELEHYDLSNANKPIATALKQEANATWPSMSSNGRTDHTLNDFGRL